LSAPAGPVEYGPYSLRVEMVTGNMIIGREGPTGRKTVAFVETVEQWDRFVSALESGADEVAAVFAIDAEDDGEGR
jgi:hypothetical protein